MHADGPDDFLLGHADLLPSSLLAIHIDVVRLSWSLRFTEDALPFLPTAVVGGEMVHEENLHIIPVELDPGESRTGCGGSVFMEWPQLQSPYPTFDLVGYEVV